MVKPETNATLLTGSEVSKEGTHFRVWAPIRQSVDVILADDQARVFPLQKEDGGYFSGFVKNVGAGSFYKYRLDGGDKYPDPTSRYQPEGPHGWSQLIDAKIFPWTDQKWRGISIEGQVLYEMHIGTWTKEGTWMAATSRLQELADLGVTTLEVMPVAEFPGQFGWGYDGVFLFAPSHLYGTPDEFRGFVDKAHSLGMGVILDVVYNHFGPDGNYLAQFSPHYFSKDEHTDWGDGINFSGEDCGPVREFYLANIRYWIDEFHLDGFRLDATQDIHDASAEHILAAISREARARGKDREVIVIAENEPQHTRLVRKAASGGYGLDALWNDDFHHSAMVALTGRREAYYSDYKGAPQEFISAAKYGFLYQGQYYSWQKKRRGTPGLDLPPASTVWMLQNHDQVANSAQGLRIHALTDPGRYRAMTALLLLSPATPMLFQGQEFASSSPFLYFADHTQEVAEMVKQGRIDFLKQFRSLAALEADSNSPDPTDPATFERSKLDHEEKEKNMLAWKLHRSLIKLRRTDPIFAAQKARKIDGAVLSNEAFVLRYFGDDHGDRLLLINLGVDLHLNPAPEPLLAPVAGGAWNLIWSSEDPEYGGQGTAPLDTEENWKIPGHGAFLMSSAR